MRKFFVTGTSTLLLAAAAGSANAQPSVKVAYVNSQQLFQVVPGRAEAAAAYEKAQAAAADQFKAMQDTITKLQDVFNKEKDQLAQAEKLKTMKDKESVFNERADKLRADLEQRQNELQQPLMELIQKALEDYRAEMGYTMIFDVASGQGIAAIDKNLDITDKLSARIARMPAPKVMAAGASDAGAKKQAADAAKKPTGAGPAVNPVGAKKPPTPPAQ